MFDSVLICSDPLMTSAEEQASNRRWMFDLLRRPIERATGLAPKAWETCTQDSSDFNREEFFRLSEIELDPTAKQFWFSDHDIKQASKDYLAQFVTPRNLIVGYELSPETRALFDELGATYVDIWLHPVRFLDDVLFAFSSNNRKIRARLSSHEVPQEQMYLYADRLRIQTYKGWRRVEAQIPENSALFVGQMLTDKSVCQDGKMLNLLDYTDRLDQIAQEHSHIYYSRHPYLRSGDEEILRFIKQHPKMSLTSVPTYRLLASDRLTKVLGVSSSAITEAHYFGKETEYLFKPVLQLGEPEREDNYASVMQAFVSPHFWSDILADCIPTQACAQVLFTDGKDKIRDMLGFYWSYADIDKLESTRKKADRLQAPKATGRKSNRTVKSWSAPEGFYQSASQINKIEKEILRHDVISFDIFDTLIERIVDKPGDIHPMMEMVAAQVSAGRISDFKSARQEARSLAAPRAAGEEVLLKDRYLAMAAHHGMSPEQGLELLREELALELQVCKPRRIGCELLSSAKASGKRIILVSDIFFERDFILELLQSCGIEGWDKIYLSSEEGRLKHSGLLFDTVLSQEAVSPSKIFHIGDNLKSDVEMANSRGINAFHLTEKRVIADRASPSVKAFSQITDADTKSVLRGLVSREFTNGLLPDVPGCTKSDPDFLGYGIAGPMFWGFARWIADRAKEEGLEDIYFLARDGDIAKRCYDIITENDPSAPKSHYLLASRRSVNVARIETAHDILANLQTNFTPCSLSLLMKNRFGVDAQDIEQAEYETVGYTGPDDQANWGRDRKKVEEFFSLPAVVEKILTSAARERSLLLSYYSENGLTSGKQKPGFVDIGHSGTLQSSITKILGLQSSAGFYFATKSDIDRNIGDGHHAMGYVADRIDHKNTNHPYQKQILMFELLFQNKDGSFLCFEEGASGPEPKFIEMASEAPRIAFIERVHLAATRFTRDMEDACSVANIHPVLPGDEAVLGYRALLSNPFPGDADLFKEIGFENAYSSRDIRWIIGAKGEPSIWTQGADVMHQPRGTFGGNSGLSIPISAISLFVRNDRKRRKLLRDPEAFFNDSKHSAVRLIGQYAV